jgi:hypothetical protein
MYLIPCSLPPSRANLLLLSLEIKDCNPNLTKDVFSLIPVKSEAFLSIASSMINVVLMACPPYAYEYALNMHTNQEISISSTGQESDRLGVFNMRLFEILP